MKNLINLTIIILITITCSSSVSFAQSSNVLTANASTNAATASAEPFVNVLMQNSFGISQGINSSVITVVPVKVAEDGSMVEIISEAPNTNSNSRNGNKASKGSARVEVYPSPAFDFVNIRIEGKHSGNGRMLLFNIEGKLINDMRFSGGFASHEFLTEAPGIYILHLTDETGLLNGSYKIVKSNG